MPVVNVYDYRITTMTWRDYMNSLSPIAAYYMDGATTTGGSVVNEVTPGTNNGTVINTSGSMTSVAGLDASTGSAFQMQPLANHVTIPVALFSGIGDFTITKLIKTPTTTFGNALQLLGNNNTGVGLRYAHPTSTLTIYIRNGTTQYTGSISGVTLALNTEYTIHYEWTAAGVVNIYLNGSLLGSYTPGFTGTPTFVASGIAFHLLGSTAGANNGNPIYDDIYIYNYAIGSTAVATAQGYRA